ncbi:hypothetical protein Tco_0833789 [Tanacetum coccineum]
MSSEGEPKVVRKCDDALIIEEWMSDDEEEDVSEPKIEKKMIPSYNTDLNLRKVGQFCDGDLEVAFRSKTSYIWNLKGDDLLFSSRESNLYTISILDMAASSPVCLMSNASLTKS